MDRTPKGNEVLDFEPRKLPQDLLAAIGLVAAAAAQTESIIEMAIAGLLGIDGEAGYAVTAHMSAPLRASVLKSAAELRIQTGEVLDELDGVLEDIRKAQAERNELIHGSYCRKPSTGEIFLVTHEARTHVAISSRPIVIDDIKLKADAIYDAGLALMRFLIYYDLMPDLPREDRVRGINTPKERKKRRKK